MESAQKGGFYGSEGSWVEILRNDPHYIGPRP